MQSFKQFLNEGRTVSITPEQFKEWCEIHATKYIKGPYWLYRGVPSAVGFGKANSAGDFPRTSIGVPNNYTLWIDNHPTFKGYPKRSRSFIATDKYGKAGDFGDVYIMICDDSAKVARVHVSDIWHKEIGKTGLNLYGLNTYTELILKHFGLGNNSKYFNLQNSLQHVRLKDMEKLTTAHFESGTATGIQLIADLMKEHKYRDLYDLWDKMVNPKFFQLLSGADVSQTQSLGEVWVESTCVFLPFQKNPFDDVAERDQFLNWLADKNDEMAALVKTSWTRHDARKAARDDDDEPF